jgi:hypothetical protein
MQAPPILVQYGWTPCDPMVDLSFLSRKPMAPTALEEAEF